MKYTTLFFVAFLLGVVYGTGFSAKEFFQGEWDLEFQKKSLIDGSDKSELEVSRWDIKDANETLVGTYTDEKDDAYPISIEFEGEEAGTFFLGSPEEEGDVFPLFHFDFNNRTNGVYFSSNTWTDDQRNEKGFYQLFALSPISFVLSVTLTDATTGLITEVNTITGVKFVEKKDPGFLSKYGMPIMLFGVLIVSQLMKSKMAPAAAPAAAGSGDAAAPAGDAAAAPAGDSKKEK
eukprot:TRINITY_DN3460_c0_g1_i2.p1 TRINITY_DN3460_c0_g1~~TRINITY_DN3460_c0_g1_i2.p1  ORF type:complete len:234 (+),score=87.15 TRINITY_DN3460_c0_g1_i2:56-757(+)